MTIFYIYIIIFFVLSICIYYSYDSKLEEYFDNNPLNPINNFFKDQIDVFNDFVNKEIKIVDSLVISANKTAQYANSLAKDWIPNVSWVYTLKDKNIEMERARHGLPPIIPSNANIGFDIKHSDNRYKIGLA
jgi:hypothetical protein